LNSGNALLMHQMVGNQLRQGLMMLNNEEIVRELYAAAEGSGKDIAKFVSLFSDEGKRNGVASKHLTFDPVDGL
jgi:hypothetical protein